MTSKTKVTARETKSMREGRATLRANWGAKKYARVMGKIRALMAELDKREATLRKLREGRPSDVLRAEIRKIALKACGLTLEQAIELLGKRPDPTAN